MNFFTAVEDENGELHTSHWKIFCIYTKSWLLLDIVSSIPISLIQALTTPAPDPNSSTSGSGSNSNVMNVRIIKLSRLPRLYRLLRLLKTDETFQIEQIHRNDLYVAKHKCHY
jgi:hypothetical protein